MGKIADALDKIDSLDELNSISEEIVESKQAVSRKETLDHQPPPAKEVEPLIKPTEINGKWDERLFKAVNNDTVLPEVFKTLRSKIFHPLNGRSVPKTIMVASSMAKEGKSFVTTNLGISFANGLDQHCLLVDCDLRHPSLARMFGIKRNFGLADYLRDHVDLNRLILKTSVQKLSVLPSGQIPQNPSELLSSTRMQKFIQEVSDRYEDRIVIFDSPPMLLAAESIVLAGHVDAVILVIRQGKARKDEIQKFIDTVGEKKILGIVFNDHTTNYLDQSLVQGYGY